MLRQAALFLLLGVLGQTAAENDYYPVDFVENINNQEAWQSRIVSGWEAHDGQHPHQVSLRMVDPLGTVSACGGSVVARDWVITSAHCTAGRVSIVVRAGVVALTRPEVIVESTRTFNHPSFDASRPTVVQPNDIALVQLPVKLQYTSNLQPIRIQSTADAFRNYADLVVYASGFGRTWTNGPTTEELRWVYLRAVSNPTCASVFGSAIITQTTLCARYFNVTSQSVCQGDSGGPLVHVNAQGVPILVGVSSFVAGEPFGCHSGLPAGFARPGPFHAWYQSVTGIDFENLNEEEYNTTTTTITVPTITIPTTSTPNITIPTTTVPTITVPTITIPTTSSPNITFPTTSTPNITFPTTTTPNITFPTTTTPNITFPTTSTPNITFPTTSTPNITFPTTSTPNITFPTTTTPNITFPTTTTPNITFPTTTTPNITIATTTAPNVTTTTISSTTLTTPLTTVTPPTTPPTPEGDGDEEEDPELSELLKKLEVQVKVLVRLSKHGRRTEQVL